MDKLPRVEQAPGLQGKALTYTGKLQQWNILGLQAGKLRNSEFPAWLPFPSYEL